jgi:glycosyltransferase involved in cell wall biosynthesis
MHSVSVIIPCYNAGVFLHAAIASVLAQTHPAAEIIVVDDGSSDASVGIAESFGPPVRVIRQRNRGDCAARNRGLDAATGEVVAFLDADDLWRPSKLERQLAYLDTHPDVEGVTCSVDVRERDRVIRTFAASDARLRAAGPLDFLATSMPPALCTTLAIRGERARAVRFPEGLSRGGDIVYSALLRYHILIGAVEQVLATYRRHATQRTRAPMQWRMRLESRLTWVREHYREVGARSARAAELALLSYAAHESFQLYWSRDLEAFKRRRRLLLRLWPEGAPVPQLLTRPVLPLLVLRVRDAVDRMITKPGAVTQ